MTPLLEAVDASVSGRLHPTSLSVDKGELVALIGPNGSGKTSLLRALAGIELSKGTVRIDRDDLTSASPARRRRLLSFLPASRDLVWPISARDVIQLGLQSPDPKRVDGLLDRLELAPLADRPTSQLSTGERARVLLGRAIAAQPCLLLLDEPLSNLDPYWVLKTLELLRELVGSGCSAVVSLHDIDKAERFDRVLLMNGGSLEADGPPATVLASDTLANSFRIEKGSAGWRVRPREDRRSSP